MNKLHRIADAIIDSAAEEHRDFNLESIESVQLYAKNAMEIDLTDIEAQLIRVTCLRYIEKECSTLQEVEECFINIFEDLNKK